MGEEFRYGGGTVPSGERVHLKHEVSETYLNEPVTAPVTIVNGPEPGPAALLVAAVHGDELNGVEVVRRAAEEFDHRRLHGTLVCVHVANVPGFLAGERYVPFDGADLNRAFPGRRTGKGTERIADSLYRGFVRHCDFGIDFHTSTRGRTNLVHVRGDLDVSGVERLARAFAANVVLDEAGPAGSLRRVASAEGIPTITVEMGAAGRFQPAFVAAGVEGTRSVLAEYGLHPERLVRWPGWQATVSGEEERQWVRAEAGGVVESYVGDGDVVYRGEPLCRITNPFGGGASEVNAPFTGLVVGVLANPLAYPGKPLCHLVSVPKETRQVIEARRRNGG
jgi:predicted deacylase